MVAEDVFAPPSACVITPNSFVSLNHSTAPVAMCCSNSFLLVKARESAAHSVSRVGEDQPAIRHAVLQNPRERRVPASSIR